MACKAIRRLTIEKCVSKIVGQGTNDNKWTRTKARGTKTGIIFILMKAFLLLFFLLASLFSICQDLTRVNRIDFLTKQIDSQIGENKAIKPVYIMGSDKVDFLEESYFIDTSKKVLHKVISLSIVESTHVPVKKRNGNSINLPYTERDTLQSIYYFNGDSLIKVQQHINDVALNFYFEGSACLQKTGSHHGRVFIVSEETASKEFLKKAKDKSHTISRFQFIRQAKFLTNIAK